MALELDKLLRDEALIAKVAEAIYKTAGENLLDDYGFHPEARAAVEAVVNHIMIILSGGPRATVEIKL